MEPSQNKLSSMMERLRLLRHTLSSHQRDVAMANQVLGEELVPVSFADLVRLIPAEGDHVWRSIERCLTDAILCCDAPLAPIVAVMGLLNAGKSSLVSTFLSENNRKRVLVGSSNSQGTHRFVLWIPSEWQKNSAIWEYLQTRLLTIFGTHPELLSNDPARAAEQYNDTSTRTVRKGDLDEMISSMEVPLLGFDDELNKWSVALMDCPDVQTGLLPNSTPALRSDRMAKWVEHTAEKRLDILARSSPICSSFLIVLPANAMHDQKVSQLMHLLRQRMPHTQQIAVVNRVPRRYTSHAIYSELSNLYRNEMLDRCYMAYGFDGPLDRDKIPAPPDDWKAPSEGTSLPLFFRIDTTPCPQPPGSIPQDGWLLRIGSQLNKQNLLEEAIHSHLARLQAEVTHAIQTVRAQVSDSSVKRSRMRQSLAEACLEFSIDPTNASKVRLQASRQIVEQLSQSLERTAPWWAMPGRWTAKIAEYGKSQIDNVSKRIVPSWISGGVDNMVQGIRSRWSSNRSANVVSSSAFIEAMKRNDNAGDWHLDDPNNESIRQQLKSLAQHCVDRFQSESQTRLDATQLDEVTREMWSQMSWSNRLWTGIAPATALFAPLIAVTLIPFDFGGSGVLVFASLKELLGAGVAGVASGVGLAILRSEMPKLAEAEAAWQQLSDLVAICCDTFDLDRPSVENPITVSIGGVSRPIPVSNLPYKSLRNDTTSSRDTLVSGASVHPVVPPKILWHGETLRQLEATLQDLNASL